MKTYVLIFRQAPRTLTAADLQQRAADTRAWAQQLLATGHKLDPRILTPEAVRVTAGQPRVTGPASADHPVTALLFIEARDFNDATAVAEAHPALHYGSTVEVREWAPPAPPAP